MCWNAKLQKDLVIISYFVIPGDSAKDHLYSRKQEWWNSQLHWHAEPNNTKCSGMFVRIRSLYVVGAAAYQVLSALDWLCSV